MRSNKHYPCGMLLGFWLLFCVQHPLQALSFEENAVLAALSLNIVRFTTWPTDTSGTVDFCVVGDNLVQQSFAAIDNKPVGDKIIRIINLSRLSNFEQCNVLFISELKQNILLQVLLEIKKLPVLSIGTGSDFAEQGGIVGLENIDNKMTLHINIASVHEANLTISSRLLSLAKIINKQ